MPIVLTADSLVSSASAVWTELAISQDCRRLKISKQFCPVSKCGVNWVLSCPDPVCNSQNMVTSYLVTGSRLVHKCVHTAHKSGQNCSVSSLLRTTENCLRLSPARFTPPTPMRRASLVMSALAVWTIGIIILYAVVFAILWGTWLCEISYGHLSMLNYTVSQKRVPP